MIHLFQRGSVTPAEYAACRVEATKEQKRLLELKTTHYYEVTGRERFCIVGIMPFSLLSRDATVWVLWFADSRPILSELRQAKPMAKALIAKHNLTLHADVSLQDNEALRFARFFNFNPTQQLAGYQMYRGVS
jgi:hypothetical protein